MMRICKRDGQYLDEWWILIYFHFVKIAVERAKSKILNLPWPEQRRENATQLSVTRSTCIVYLILSNDSLFDDVVECCYSLD
jgi:hypothetical protein